MHVRHLASSAIREMMAKGAAKAVPQASTPEAVTAAAPAVVLDQVEVQPVPEIVLDSTVTEEDSDEGVLDSAGAYANTDLALKAVAGLQEWAETGSGDLDEGEGLGDRLFALMAGIVDDDLDGEISDEEAELLSIVAEEALDYLISKGVPEDDATSLLSDFDNELADSVQELLIAKLPDGDDAAADEMEGFAFGDGSDESVMDAVYKKRLVVRKGKKVRINKRISGKVRLSAKQKVAVRKMLRKSHSAKAQLRRAKSMKVRARSSI